MAKDLQPQDKPNDATRVEAIHPLRRRMIEDMSVRRFGEKTQSNYIRRVANFAKFLGRPLEAATGEDLRRYHVHLPRLQSRPGRQRLKSLEREHERGGIQLGASLTFW